MVCNECQQVPGKTDDAQRRASLPVSPASQGEATPTPPGECAARLQAAKQRAAPYACVICRFTE